MTWLADLSLCTYSGIDQFGDIKAIGWLEPDRQFDAGAVERDFFTALCRLLQQPWFPIAWGGSHACRLCQFAESAQSVYFAPHVGHFNISSRGSTVLLVPGTGVLYAAPDSVAHYIDAHHYAPPKEFQDAVLHCPEMGSAKYFQALLANGGSRELREYFQVGEKPL